MIDLTKLEKKLLSHLAFNGPTIANQIAEIQNTSRTAQKLMEKGLLTRTAGKHDFSPRPAFHLSFTVKGLAHALLGFLMKGRAAKLLDKNTLDNLYEIVMQWRGFIPEVFQKWDYFKREGIEYIAARRLIYAAFSVTDSSESMRRAGHLWTPKPNSDSEEHMKTVFTRFFFDMIYDPTFNRNADLAKWISSQKETDLDISDCPLLIWVEALKKNPDTRNHIEKNYEISQGEIGRLEILSSLLGQGKADLTKLEKSFLKLWNVFYAVG